MKVYEIYNFIKDLETTSTELFKAVEAAEKKDEFSISISTDAVNDIANMLNESANEFLNLNIEFKGE